MLRNSEVKNSWRDTTGDQVNFEIKLSLAKRIREAGRNPRGLIAADFFGGRTRSLQTEGEKKEESPKKTSFPQSLLTRSKKKRQFKKKP